MVEKQVTARVDTSSDVSTSSLFVRNLSYDTTSEQLETLLADIGIIWQPPYMCSSIFLV